MCEMLIFLQQNPSTTWSTLLWNTKSWDAATIKHRTDSMKSSVQSNLSVSFHFLLWRKRHIKAHAKVCLYQPLKFWRKFGVSVERKIEINLCNLTFKGLLSNGLSLSYVIKLWRKEKLKIVPSRWSLYNSFPIYSWYIFYISLLYLCRE